MLFRNLIFILLFIIWLYVVQKFGYIKNIFESNANTIISVSTVIYMLFTGWLIWETRVGRKQMQRPHIEVYFKRREDWGSMLELVIKNIWFSGAYDIKLSSSKDFDLLDNKEFPLSKLWYFKNGISFLPVNAERTNSAIILSTDYEEKIKWKIEIYAEYKDWEWKTYKNTFLLDLSEFESSFLPKEDPKYNIEKHLKKISDDIHKFWTWFSKIRVISQDLKEFREEQKR